MSEHPRDMSDLFLAPVALEVDARIAELGALTDEKLVMRVALESDEPDWSAAQRKEALLRTIGYLIELHHWELGWDIRGIRLSHGQHSLVLGVPPSFKTYIDDGPRS